MRGDLVVALYGWNDGIQLDNCEFSSAVRSILVKWIKRGHIVMDFWVVGNSGVGAVRTHGGYLGVVVGVVRCFGNNKSDANSRVILHGRRGKCQLAKVA